jgi:DNA-binding Lrp family transcriptional regulator
MIMAPGRKSVPEAKKPRILPFYGVTKMERKLKIKNLKEITARYENSQMPQWVMSIAADKISSSNVPFDYWEDFFQDCMVWYLKSEKQKHLYANVCEVTRVGAGINNIFKTLVNRLKKAPGLKEKYALTKNEVITVDFIRFADELPLESLRRAVRRAVAALDKEKRTFCKMIMDMLEPRQICKRLGRSHWYYKRQIREIRREFYKKGILDIIKWRRDYLIQRSRESQNL